VAGAKWIKDDFRPAAQVAGIFVIIGAIWGFFSEAGLIIGAIAGALCFGLVIGISALIELMAKEKQ
jgi:hypothetical protein